MVGWESELKRENILTFKLPSTLKKGSGDLGIFPFYKKKIELFRKVVKVNKIFENCQFS